jgi:hypothetical protein
VLPIGPELTAVHLGPLSDEAKRDPGTNVADDHMASQVKLALLALVLGMEMSGLVLFIVHPKNIEITGI